jgi:hypothetical protein
MLQRYDRQRRFEAVERLTMDESILCTRVERWVVVLGSSVVPRVDSKPYNIV